MWCGLLSCSCMGFELLTNFKKNAGFQNNIQPSHIGETHISTNSHSCFAVRQVPRASHLGPAGMVDVYQRAPQPFENTYSNTHGRCVILPLLPLLPLLPHISYLDSVVWWTWDLPLSKIASGDNDHICWLPIWIKLQALILRDGLWECLRSRNLEGLKIGCTLWDLSGFSASFLQN